MTEEQIALARRAFACKGWRWMPGMRALPCSPHDSGLRGIPVRVVHVYDGDGLVVWGEVPGAHSGSWEEWRWREEGRLPDLTDPATLGCLLALVREAWDDPGIACVTSSYINGRYHRRVVDGHHHGSTFQRMSQATYSTEAEALVAALEAAPKRGEHRREVKP